MSSHKNSVGLFSSDAAMAKAQQAIMCLSPDSQAAYSEMYSAASASDEDTFFAAFEEHVNDPGAAGLVLCTIAKNMIGKWRTRCLQMLADSENPTTKNAAHNAALGNEVNLGLTPDEQRQASAYQSHLSGGESPKAAGLESTASFIGTGRSANPGNRYMLE